MQDPGLHEILGRAGERGLPVNLHVTDPASRPYPGRVETPLHDFVRLARGFPGTTFVLAHWGGMLPRVLTAEARAALPNVYVDTAASPLLYGDAVWPGALRDCGAERVLFGSDYPLHLYPRLEGEPGMARLLAAARAGGADAAVLGGNAARLLRLA